MLSDLKIRTLRPRHKIDKVFDRDGVYVEWALDRYAEYGAA